MSQDASKTKQQHEKFIKTVCETGIVWALENEDGFATSGSNEYEDEDGEPIEMICFWSEKALALSCAIEDWSQYKPAEIPLNDFIENWCTGMSNDGLLMGINFDENMLGSEIDPLDLIVELGKELKAQGKDIQLKGYNNLDDLLNAVNEAIGE